MPALYKVLASTKLTNLSAISWSWSALWIGSVFGVNFSLNSSNILCSNLILTCSNLAKLFSSILSSSIPSETSPHNFDKLIPKLLLKESDNPKIALIHLGVIDIAVSLCFLKLFTLLASERIFRKFSLSASAVPWLRSKLAAFWLIIGSSIASFAAPLKLLIVVFIPDAAPPINESIILNTGVSDLLSKAWLILLFLIIYSSSLGADAKFISSFWTRLSRFKFWTSVPISLAIS